MNLIRPNPKQCKVIRQANSRWNLLIGATRSGKTYAQYLLCPVRIANLPNTGLHVLLAKTMGNVESNLLQPMRDIYGNAAISQVYKRGNVNRALLFGREYYVMGADNLRAVDKLRGKSITHLLGDEGPTWPPEVLQMLKTRLDKPYSMADITGNPEGPAHPFKKDLIDRADALGVYHEHFTLFDNPNLDEAIKEQLRGELVGVWYQRLVLGNWAAAEGAIYDMLDARRHVTADLPDITRYWVGVDYGTASVTTFWLLGLGADERLYFTDFWRWDAAAKMRQLTDVEAADAMQEWLQAQGVIVEYAFVPQDAASFLTQLNRHKQAGRLANVKHLAAADQTPGSVLRRIRNIASLLQLDRLRFAQQIYDRGGLDEWQGYIWDAKAQEKGDDVPVKKDDHNPDAGGYAIIGARTIWQHWVAKSAEAA